MFVEIFGFAAWTRALYPEEIRDVALGPWTLLGKHHRFWYAPFMAYRTAAITGDSSWPAEGFRGTPRSAVIAGASSSMAYLRPAASPERTLPIRAEGRSVSPVAESRMLTVRGENRSVEA
jgi:hypothetical protein